MKILVWEMRTSKGFTLMELSKKSGIGKSTINKIEPTCLNPNTNNCITLQRDSGSRRNDFHDYGNQPRYFHNDGNI